MSAGGPAGVCGRGRGRITPGFRFYSPSEGTEAAGVPSYTENSPWTILALPVRIYGGVFGFYLKSSEKPVRCRVQRGPCGTLYAATDIFVHNSTGGRICAGPDGAANRRTIRHTENTMRTGAANPLKNERVGIGAGNPVKIDRVDDEGRGVTNRDTPVGSLQSGLTPKTRG